HRQARPHPLQDHPGGDRRGRLHERRGQRGSRTAGERDPAQVDRRSSGRRADRGRGAAQAGGRRENADRAVLQVPGRAPRGERVKPAPFEYHCPRTVDEGTALLARYGDDAKVLACGQSLVPLMNMRLARPANLIAINRIGSLAYIPDDARAARIGALTRPRAAERARQVAEPCPPPRHALRLVGHAQTRRHGDCALAGVGVVLAVRGGKITAARIGLTGVGPTPVRPAEAERLLTGQTPSEDLWNGAAEAVRAAVAPDGDIHASAEYRTHVAGVLTQRALREAWERAREAA